MAKQSISKSKRVCQVEGCEGKYHLKGYCCKHYTQLLRHGKILLRTRFDLNDSIFDGNICRIKLYDRKDKEIAETIIDKEDYEKVKDMKWCLSSGGYAVRVNKTKRTEYLHWWIIGQPLCPYHTDHVSGDKLDNRKCNLRCCSCSQNQMNAGKQKNNTSGFKGVSWSKGNRKWIAEIQYKGKKLFRKGFDSKIEAAREYDKAVLKYCDKFAFINEI
jgi:hypothetical protein